MPAPCDGARPSRSPRRVSSSSPSPCRAPRSPRGPRSRSFRRAGGSGADRARRVCVAGEGRPAPLRRRPDGRRAASTATAGACARSPSRSCRGRAAPAWRRPPSADAARAPSSCAPPTSRPRSSARSSPSPSGCDVRAARAALGARGPVVTMLQRSLRALGYVTGPRGIFDAPHRPRGARLPQGRRAWIARTVADASVFRALARGKGRFRVRYPRHGRHVEADLSRQVLALVEGARVARIYPRARASRRRRRSSGSFRVYSKTAGTNAKGMLDSNYFIRGYAIHGYAVGADLRREPRLPAHPERRGRLRLPVAADRRPRRRLPVGGRASGRVGLRHEQVEHRRHPAAGVRRTLAVGAVALAQDPLDPVEHRRGAQLARVRARALEGGPGDLARGAQRAVERQPAPRARRAPPRTRTP